MRLELLCPACGLRVFDSNDYDSMILLAQNLALVQFRCPGCGLNLSVTMRLTQTLYREAIKRLAQQDGDKPTELPTKAAISYASHLVVDCQPDGIFMAYPFSAGNPEVKAQLEYFKRQLEKVDTVDEAISEIGPDYHREKRDS
jgi:hypothetical protein